MSSLLRLVFAALVAVFSCSSSLALPGPGAAAGITTSVSKSGDPVAFVGHGKLFDRSGRIIEPTAEFVREALGYYINNLENRANEKTLSLAKRQKAKLKEQLKTDEMSQRFLLMEWLISEVAPENGAALYARNVSMRRAWYKKVYGLDRYLELIDPSTFLPKEVSDFATANNMLRKSTTSTGREYIKECREAGVPIPPDWRDEGPGAWNHVGDLGTNFLGFGNPASVYRFDSNAPAGLCMALPRIDGKNIEALGVICMGRESSNVCFYDAVDVGIQASKKIETFLSGGGLGNTGVCTDCHAGENPYVVHPNSPLDMTPDHFTKDWYTPLVRPDWPQNPGPFALLSQVMIDPLPPVSDADCEACHKKPIVGAPDLGNTDPAAIVAGRFPNILALNQSQGIPSGYCGVLTSAMGSTMPGGGAYQVHVDAMKAFCAQAYPPGGEVPPPDAKDDPDTISPPIVVGPLYACAEAIEVRGGIYGAELTVTIDGTALPSVQITMPSSTILPTPPLVAGQVIVATQKTSTAASGPSQPVTVVDHTLAYPNGLPNPLIDPQTIHECGRTIAVRHVRGAKVSVFTNGADEVTYSTGGDWTNLPPKIRPFNLNDEYTAQQHLCKESSGLSFKEQAGVEPNPFPVPELDPSPPIPGQQVIDLRNLPEGALTIVSETVAGELSKFSTAVNRQDEVDVATGLGRPIAAGDAITVVSELCSNTKVSIPEARPCKSLPAPRISTPLVGATSVYVTSAVAGARILIYDAGLVEIGDGSGNQIGLTRALVAGDVLTVVQQLGECTSAKAYQTGVVCASSGQCD